MVLHGIMDENCEVAFQREVAGGVFLLGIKSHAIAGKAAPGQFVMVRVRNSLSPLLRRPFSICGVVDGIIVLLYMVVGEGTEILSGTLPGQRISVLGPLGNGFRLPSGIKRIFLVGGGMGIAPLLFLAGRIEPGHAVFMAGYRSSEKAVPIKDLGLPCPGIQLATEDGSEGVRGLVTDLLELRIREDNIEDPVVFACGPVPMLRRVSSLCLELGISCQISLEAHMACGLGACQGCAVPGSKDSGKVFFHVCKDGPVFDAGMISWGEL